MFSKKARMNEYNGKKGKLNWIERLTKGIKVSEQKEISHCSDYSSVICLRCDKCWAGISRKAEEIKEK